MTVSIVAKDAPTAAEHKANILLATQQLMTFTDDQGDPVNNDLSGLVLVVPYNMLWITREAVNASIISTTSNVMQGVADVVAWPWLTDTDTWYLLKTDGVIKPFIFQDREPLEFTSLEKDSDEGFRREKFLYGVRARYRMSYGLWQHAIRYVYTTT